MRIYYTNKLVFWNNEGQDYLEKNRFDTYFDGQWTEVSNTKSINWDGHYTANFYASDSFEATYFKIEKDTKTYYFFIEDIEFDSNRGKKYTLSLDFYNTYVVDFIETLKQQNPLVVFKRKHADRGISADFAPSLSQHPYYLNVPSHLKKFSDLKRPTNKVSVSIPTKTNYTVSLVRVNTLTPETITINDNDFRFGGKYYYLKVKKPPKLPTGLKGDGVEDLYVNEIYYVPIKTVNGWDSINNGLKYAQQWPSDYVVGFVRTCVPPSVFGTYGWVADVYSELKIDNSSVLTTDYSFACIAKRFPNGGSSPSFLYRISTNQKIYNQKPNGLTYNIDNMENEPMLYTSPFLHFSMNNEQKIFLERYFDGQQWDELYSIDLDFVINTDILTSFNLRRSIDFYNYTPSYYASFVEEVPFSSNVYNNYLLNNINSINTSISLAKQQRDMDIGFGVAKEYTNFATSLGSSLLGFGLLGGSNGKFGHNFLMSGIAGTVSAPLNMAQTVAQAAFDYKRTVDTIEANKADQQNKPNSMLDTYGDGVAANGETSNIVITTHAIPNQFLKIVFSDFYFSGYLVNTVLNFNEYDNRVAFNYFEIGNCFNLVSQYIKHPKTILNEIAAKCERGLRLWKTFDFDYTMKTDNREN